MTTLELVLNMLEEAVITEISRQGSLQPSRRTWRSLVRAEKQQERLEKLPRNGQASLSLHPRMPPSSIKL